MNKKITFAKNTVTSSAPQRSTSVQRFIFTYRTRYSVCGLWRKWEKEHFYIWALRLRHAALVLRGRSRRALGGRGAPSREQPRAGGSNVNLNVMNTSTRKPHCTHAVDQHTTTTLARSGHYSGSGKQHKHGKHTPRGQDRATGCVWKAVGVGKRLGCQAPARTAPQRHATAKAHTQP